MKVMVIVRATEDSEAGSPPARDMLEAMGKYNQELIAAGIMQTGDGLKASDKGARVHFSGLDRTVTRGPFPVNEVVAGFWIWDVKSLEEAIDWAKRCPNPMPGPSSLEIRPFIEMEDFGEALTPELRQQEADQRKQLGQG
jgi:hypothetical protein